MLCPIKNYFENRVDYKIFYDPSESEMETGYLGMEGLT